MRTPLAGLKTQAQIALTATDPMTKEGALRQILVSVDRTARLVRQLLAIAKLDAGFTSEEKEIINRGQLIAEVVHSLHPGSAQISIDIGSSLHELRIRANRELLTLVVRNLHENSLQHMPGGGTVSWQSIASGNGIVVQDDGPGIPADELPLVTQRFFRGRHKSALGRGLGLAIVAEAVRHLKGTFTLQNRSDGNGLRIAITLPETSIDAA